MTESKLNETLDFGSSPVCAAVPAKEPKYLTSLCH